MTNKDRDQDLELPPMIDDGELINIDDDFDFSYDSEGLSNDDCSDLSMGEEFMIPFGEEKSFLNDDSSGLVDETAFDLDEGEGWLDDSLPVDGFDEDIHIDSSIKLEIHTNNEDGIDESDAKIINLDDDLIDLPPLLLIDDEDTL